MSEFMEVPTIDGHVHVRAVSGFEDQLKLIEQHGFAAINAVCTAARNESSLKGNLVGLLFKGLYPDKVYVCGGLNYTLPPEPTKEDLRAQGEALLEAGCDGIKMIEGKPPARKRTGLALDAPAYDGFYDLLQSRGTPIVYHVADPETWWDPEQAPQAARGRNPYWEDPDMPSKEQLYGEVDGILAKFPDLRIIFAHFYFMSNFPDRAGEFMDKHPEISFDITPGSEMYRNFSKIPERWREFFVEYQDRIVFGTDNITPREPRDERYKSMADKIWMMRMFLETDQEFEGFGSSAARGIGLERDVLEKIYYKNFQRYAGASPKKLNVDAAIGQCNKLVDAVSNNSKAPEVLADLNEILERLQNLD